MTPEIIDHLFIVLQAAGLRPPDVYKTQNGLKQGIAIYSVALQELTEQEIDAAAKQYVCGSSPYWPTPGQLLKLVPGLVESRRSLKSVDAGRPLSLLENAVLARVGSVDAEAYCQAYRVMLALWDATPAAERFALDERGYRTLRLSATIEAALPKLLTVNREETS